MQSQNKNMEGVNERVTPTTTRSLFDSHVGLKKTINNLRIGLLILKECLKTKFSSTTNTRSYDDKIDAVKLGCRDIKLINFKKVKKPASIKVLKT